VPVLFAAEEWGASSPFRYFTGHESPELAQAVRRGRREEFASFGWDFDAVPDPQDPATFSISKLRWDERDEPVHADLLAWYRGLIAIRRANAELRDADRSAVLLEQDVDCGWLVVRRGPIRVAINLGDEPVEVPVEGQVRLAWPFGLSIRDGSVRLPPDGVVVVADDR
jgi:maltooligosyltrehalose trehalohydrolase